MNNSTLRYLVSIRALLGATAAVILSAAALLTPAPAQAVIGANDNACRQRRCCCPISGVDLNNPNGVRTSMRVSNASASAGMLNVALWSDWGLPTMSFSIYLTGYDTSEIDLRLVFDGHLPRAADAGSDSEPTRYRPKAAFRKISTSRASVRPTTTSRRYCRRRGWRRCATPTPASPARRSAAYAAAQAYGDGIARGYVTIDTVVARTERLIRPIHRHLVTSPPLPTAAVFFWGRIRSSIARSTPSPPTRGAYRGRRPPIR